MKGKQMPSTVDTMPDVTNPTDKRIPERQGRQWSWPVLAGAAGAVFLTGVYLGIVTLAQGWQHAVELLWQDRFLVAPIIAGFGTQVGLYVYVKVGLRAAGRGQGAMASAGGGTSTAAMVACCVHHVTDLLPLVGLSAATAFLANYRVPFMLLGLAMNLVGIGLALKIISNERRRTQGLVSRKPRLAATGELE
jgi:hypothetical protein